MAAGAFTYLPVTCLGLTVAININTCASHLQLMRPNAVGSGVIPGWRSAPGFGPAGPGRAAGSGPVVRDKRTI